MTAGVRAAHPLLRWTPKRSGVLAKAIRRAMAERVGIKDVAAADVSVTTVSHILSEVEGKRVSPCEPSPDWCTTICIDVS
jgi:hypothetical protein